jgi:hypothetical protein
MSVSTIASESSEAGEQQRLRAQLKLTKRKLEAAEGRVRDKDAAIEAKQREVAVKERVIAERDTVVRGLQQQVKEQLEVMEKMQGLGFQEGVEAGDVDKEEVQV